VGLPNILIGRTGYTAEDGFEIYIPADEKISAHVWYERFWKRVKSLASFPAGWARATLCGWKAACLSTGTKSQTRSMCGKRGWIVSARWRRRIFMGRAALEKAKARGVKKTLVGLEMVDRGIARDGYKVLDDAGARLGM
jgi:aminomethyltransferase